MDYTSQLCALTKTSYKSPRKSSQIIKTKHKKRDPLTSSVQKNECNVPGNIEHITRKIKTSCTTTADSNDDFSIRLYSLFGLQGTMKALLLS